MKSKNLLFSTSRSRALLGSAAALLFAVPTIAYAQTPYTWTSTVNGAGPHAWDDDANWSGTGFPNATGDVASLTADWTTAATVNLNQAITVGSLTINDSGGTADSTVTVQTGAAGTLALDNTGSTAVTLTLSSTAGTSLITAPTTLNDPLNVSVSGGGTLQLNNFTGGSNTFTKTGTGTFTLSTALPLVSSYSGAANINAGTLSMSFSVNTAAASFTVNPGVVTTLDFINGIGTVSGSNATTIRAAGVVLNGQTFLIGRATVSGANVRDNISGALTLNNSFSRVTLTPTGVGQVTLSAGSLVVNSPASVLFRGSNLGIGAINGASGVLRSNVVFTTAPTLNSAGTGTAVGILPYALGDTGVAATDLGDGLVTYDAGILPGDPTDDVGIRLLNSATETVASVTAAATGDNVLLTANETDAPAKTVNSLQLQNFAVSIASGQTLTVSSGAVTGGTTAAASLTGGILNLGGGANGHINTTGNPLTISSDITGATTIRRATGSANTLTLSGVISDNGATPANVFIAGASQTTNTVLSGVSTYTGTTTLERGTLTIGANAPEGAPGALGNGTSALVLATAQSAYNERIVLNLLNGVTLGRDISSIQAQSASSDANTQRIRLGIDEGTAAVNSATISSTSTITIANRRVSLQAGNNDTLNVDALITGTGGINMNEGNSGNSSGRVRLTNSANNFTSSFTVTNGILVAGGTSNIGGTGNNSVVGTGSVSLGDGGSGNASVTGLLLENSISYARAVGLSNYSSTGYLTANHLLGTISGGDAFFTGAINTSASNLADKFIRLTAESATSQVTFTGAISGNTDGTKVANVEKIGLGTVILTGANTWDGTTTLTAGSLIFGNPGSLPAGALTVATGTTLGVRAGDGVTGYTNAQIITLLNSVSEPTGTTFAIDTGNGDSSLETTGFASALGNFAFKKTGANTLTLLDGMAPIYDGIITISGGALLATTKASLPQYDDDPSKIILDGGVVAGRIGGLAEFSLGELDALRGIVEPAMTVNGGGVGVDTTNGDVDYSATILTGTVGLGKFGPNNLTVNAANTYTGATTINGGVLIAPVIADLGAPSSLGAGSAGIGVVNFSGTGTLRYTGTGATASTNREIVIGTGTSIPTFQGTIEIVDPAMNFTLNGPVRETGFSPTGTHGLRKTGPGTLTFAGDGSFDNQFLTVQVSEGLVVAASASGQGKHAVANVIVDSGTTFLIAGTTSAQTVFDGNQIYFGAGATVNGTLDLNGRSETVGSLTGTGTVTSSVVGAVTFSVGGNNSTGNALNTLIEDGGGTLSLVKVGGGTTTITGGNPNTFTGGTTVTAGNLKLNKTAGVNAVGGDGNIAVTGGIVNLAANDQIPDTADITVTETGSFRFHNEGTSATNETIHSVSASGGSVLTNSRVDPAAFISNTINLTGDLTVSGTAQFLVNSGATVNVTGAVSHSSTIAMQVGSNAVSQLTAGSLSLNGAILQLNRGASGSTLLLNGGVTTVAHATATANISAQALTTGGDILGKIDLNGGNRTFDIADGAVATDFATSANITNGSVTKAGPGTMVLSGPNTYEGNTLVNAGTLQVADNGQLTFVLGATSGTNNGISGPGTAILDGDFVIDTTLAGPLTNGTWQLENAGTANYGSNFSVVGFDAQGATQWVLDAGGGNQYTFDETTGVLTLAPFVAPAGYQAFIDGFSAQIPNAPDRLPDVDFENDTMNNLLEYVLNGDPSVSDLGKLPKLQLIGPNFVFTYTRRAESANDTTQVFQYGSTLAIGGWTGIAITPSSQVAIVPGDLGLENVTVTIPQSFGVDGKLFGRLFVSQ